MPLTRPRAISNGVTLSDKLRRKDAGFIAEGGAVDSLLPLARSLVDTVVDELAPHEKSVRCCGPENDPLPRPDELSPWSPVAVSVAGVMSLIHCEARSVAVL